MKVKVNKNVCISCGSCYACYPEMFEADDEYKSEVTKEFKDKELKGEELNTANEAKDMCPVQAIDVD